MSEAVNCHHNYVAREAPLRQNVLVTRKGAVRARKGDLGIIPGSMGARSYIVRGNRQPGELHELQPRRRARHVAHRGQAALHAWQITRRRRTGVECRKDADVIDETPAAYKSIDAVMAAQTDLVEIVHTLRQVVCVKG